MSEPQHQLQWRGRSAGPWTLAQIRAALDSGEIHSLYRVCVDGEWLALRDYLEQVDAADLARRAAELGSNLRQKELEKPAVFTPLAQKRTLGFGTQVQRPNPFGNPPPVLIKIALQSRLDAASPDTAMESASPPTCWLAVTAFVISCAGFVPYLNLVSWLPSIILGHIALAQIRRQPVLEGRGLALGAVIIGYAILTLAVLSFLFAPALFYRVFPVGDS
jgi:hypothetical protein